LSVAAGVDVIPSPRGQRVGVGQHCGRWSGMDTPILHWGG
jgi:hypothetical protein